MPLPSLLLLRLLPSRQKQSQKWLRLRQPRLLNQSKWLSQQLPLWLRGGANQYTTEAQAKARCGSGTVVWANLKSKIYHFAGHKDYGNTKEGAYMCERDATSEGMRAAKNEKHP